MIKAGLTIAPMRSPAFILSGVLCAGSALGIPADAELPSIPSDGWNADRGAHVLWHRKQWQIADFNADGRIDYIRFPDPLGSYTHRIWTDRDYDGRFDTYSSAAGGVVKIDLPAPGFPPAMDRLKANR